MRTRPALAVLLPALALSVTACSGGSNAKTSATTPAGTAVSSSGSGTATSKPSSTSTRATPRTTVTVTRTAAPPAGSSPSTAAALPGATACQGQPAQVRPASIVISCGDGGVSVNNIAWSSWSGSSARGMGTYAQNNCTPDCADGTMIQSRVPVVLSQPIQTSTGLRFTQMDINAGGDDPEQVTLSTN